MAEIDYNVTVKSPVKNSKIQQAKEQKQISRRYKMENDKLCTVVSFINNNLNAKPGLKV